MGLKLYTTPFCSWCERVRDDLERRQLAYEEVSVGWSRGDRREVHRLSGQYQVPVLVDGEQVVHDSARILSHLARTYPR